MRHALLVLLAAAAVCCSVAAAGSAPAGATARCRDGTYSYSRHHRGTCSHHGGVAVWLGRSPVSTAAAPRTAIVAAGRTVLLLQRTRTSGCKLAARPDRSCSPGAYYSGLTRKVICSAAFRTGDYRNVPTSEKHAVEQEYGLAPRSYGSQLEIDHIVSLELGGSNDIANLFPEKADAAPGYRVKDKLENRVHDMVCAGQISLRSARREIASDWEALYVRVFGTPTRG